MKVPSVKRILVEEFQEDDVSWIAKLLQPLNQFFQQTIACLDKGLNNENFASLIVERKVLVNSTTYPIKINWTLASKPTDLIITYCQDTASNPASLTTPPFAEWTYSNGQVVITNITGLTSGLTYKIRFWMWSNPT